MLWWAFIALHWWAAFELATYNPFAYEIYSYSIFGVTIAFLAWMLWRGSRTNRELRRLAFLKETINDKFREANEAKDRIKYEN